MKIKVKQVDGPEDNSVFVVVFSFFRSFSMFFDIIIGVFPTL